MLRLISTKLKHRALPFSHGYYFNFSTSTPKPTSVFSDPQFYTPSYHLQNSSKSDISTAQKLQIDFKHTHHSIMSLFTTHGFTETHIRNLLSKRPTLLLADDAVTNSRHNLELLKSLGFSSTTLAQLVLKEPLVLESDVKPVIEFFTSHGFSEDDIMNMTIKYPLLYTFDVHKTLKPKVEFLKSVGFSQLQIVKILTSEPYILSRSLENQLVPAVEYLRQFLGDDGDVVTVVMRCFRILEVSLEKVLKPNIAVLRNHGVSESHIARILALFPKTLVLSQDRVSEVIGFVKSLGMSPGNLTFLLALRSVGLMSKTLWEQKLETYRSFGMSEDEIYAAFKQQPSCMLVSVKKIQKMMSFFLNKLNFNTSTICKNPILLQLSLERRIIPRCSVLQLLFSQGLIEEDSNRVVYVLKMAEEVFKVKIMSKYEQEVPDIVDAHKGKIEFKGFTSFNSIK